MQTGAVTTVIIDGADLLPNPRLVSSAPISQQTIKPGATATKVEIDVAVDAKVEPGFYNLWLVTDKGVAPRQVIAVDFLPQRPMAPLVDSIPVALHGNFTGSRPVETSFTGKSGEHVTIEVEAQRLGSKEQPVIHLLDGAGREMALALPSSQLHGDARLETTLPSDGTYQVRVHDLQYAGSGPFRLKIGTWQYADAVFPPAVERGKTTNLLLIGPTGSDQHVDFTPGDLATVPAPWADASKSSGCRPILSITDFPELIDDRGASESPRILGKIALPFAISGRLQKAGQEDRYQIDVPPESSLRFEVMAAKIGSPIDAVLDIRNAKGDKLASADDAVGSPDPTLDFKTPKGTDPLMIAIRDANGRGSEAGVYRLLISPAGDKQTGPADFDLFVDDDAVPLTAGQTSLVKVIARRHGYNGAILLWLSDTPKGTEMARAVIPESADGALLEISRKSSSTDSIAAAIAHLIGEGRVGDRAIIRSAAVEKHPLAELQPWLANEIVVAPVAETDATFAAEFADVSGDALAVIGRKLVLPIRCDRPGGLEGPVRLTLLTSQSPPTEKIANRVIDPKFLVRSEVAKLEIPADAKVAAALDARVAAEKAVAEADKSAKGALDAKSKADAKVKPAADALADVTKTAKAASDAKSKADARSKLAEDALAEATKAAHASADAKSKADANVKSADEALAEATKAAGAAADAKSKLDSQPKPKEDDAADAEKSSKAAEEAKSQADAKLKLAATGLTEAKRIAADAADAKVKIDAKVQLAQGAVAEAKKPAMDAADAKSKADVKVKSAGDALSEIQKLAKAASDSKTAADVKLKTASDALAKATEALGESIALAKNKTDVTLLIPADLPLGSYDLAFRAEMLSRDGQRVMATRYTSIKRMNAISPVLVQLDSPRRIEASLDAKTGATVKWSGRIERREGATGDVTVGFEGLPKGVLDAKVTVPADKTEWKLELKIPPTVEVGETTGIKLFATIKADPKADALARSPNVELALNVVANKEAGKDPK